MTVSPFLNVVILVIFNWFNESYPRAGNEHLNDFILCLRLMRGLWINPIHNWMKMKRPLARGIFNDSCYCRNYLKSNWIALLMLMTKRGRERRIKGNLNQYGCSVSERADARRVQSDPCYGLSKHWLPLYGWRRDLHNLWWAEKKTWGGMDEGN